MYVGGGQGAGLDLCCRRTGLVCLTFLGGGRVNRVQGFVTGITWSGTLRTIMIASSGLVQVRCNSQSTVPKGPKCAMAIVHLLHINRLAVLPPIL